MSSQPVQLPDAQLSHVGLYVRDLEAMVAFYCRVLGMVISDQGPFGDRTLAFLTRNADEHHQLVMICDPTRAKGGPSSLNQLSFRLKDLEGLRTYHAFLSALSANGLEGRDHGNSWSLYFFDPEGNKIELYVPTPWAVSQPWRAPLDLTASAEFITEQTKLRMHDHPASRPAAEWSAEMAARIG